MCSSSSYAVAGLLCWATLTPVQAQNPKPPPETNPASESKITANSKLEGKTLKEWVAEIRSTDPSVQRNAMKAVIFYGRLARSEAVPAIISVLNRERGPDVSVKVNGAMALGLIGLDENNLKNGVPCLINLLSDREAIVRHYAAAALGRLGPDARSAIRHLVNLTKTREDSETRQVAVNALSGMAWDKNNKEGPDPYAFRAIGEAVGDHATQVRYEAIKALIMIGPSKVSADVANAINRLQGVLTHRDKVEVVWAHLALMRLDPKEMNDVNLKAMLKILKLGDSRIRCNAADALAMAWRLAKKYPSPPNPATITPKSGWGLAVTDLIDLLGEKDLQVVFTAINALGEFGPAAIKAKPQLEALAQHKDELIQKAANAALEKVTGREKMNLGQ